MTECKDVWGCKIGWADLTHVSGAADAPMRRAVEQAFVQITDHQPEFIFSGWGEKLTQSELNALGGLAIAKPDREALV